MSRLNRSIPPAVRNIVFVLCGLFIATVWQMAITSVATARVAPEQTDTNSPAQATAASTWVSCVPVEIATFSSRVHVKCQTAISGINYFAASTTNGPNAARILSVITAAQVAGRTLSVLYDPADTSGTAIGCQASDCRLIQAVGFGQ